MRLPVIVGSQRVDAAAGTLQRAVGSRDGSGNVLPNFRGIARAVENCWNRRRTNLPRRYRRLENRAVF